MPLVEIDEPYARPPRIRPVRPSGLLSSAPDPDHGLAEVVGLEVVGGPPLAVDGCQQLAIAESTLSGVVFDAGPEPSIEIRASRLSSCDLSGARVSLLRGTVLEGCKLSGTDLSGAVIDDVVFERCALRYVNLRMARLRRVAFVECTVDDTDAYDLEASDVTVEGSSLWAVNVDRLRATRVDLRGAVALGLRAIGRLDGCLVADHQLPQLALPLALSVGLELERPEADDEEDDR